MGKARKKTLTSAIDQALAPSGESIIELTREYWHFERALEDATNDLEALARRVAHDAEKALRETEQQEFEPERKLTAQKVTYASDEVDRKSFLGQPDYVDSAVGRRRASIVRRFCLPAAVLSPKLKLEPSLDAQLEELEEHEAKISLLRYHLQVLEQRILELRPPDADNALKKLKFISALVIDGKEFDMDYFAYLIQECAETCEEVLGEILKTYREHIKAGLDRGIRL